MGCRGGKCCPWAILTVASHRPGRLDVAKDTVQLPQPTPCRLLTGQFGAENLHCSLLPPQSPHSQVWGSIPSARGNPPAQAPLLSPSTCFPRGTAPSQNPSRTARGIPQPRDHPGAPELAQGGEQGTAGHRGRAQGWGVSRGIPISPCFAEQVSEPLPAVSVCQPADRICIYI